VRCTLVAIDGTGCGKSTELLGNQFNRFRMLTAKMASHAGRIS
jgi:hypothetical protein